MWRQSGRNKSDYGGKDLWKRWDCSLESTETMFKLSSAAVSCEWLHVCQSECSISFLSLSAECCSHAWSPLLIDWRLLWKRVHHLDIVECDTVSLCKQTRMRMFALKYLLQLEILILSVVPDDRQCWLFNFHTYNDVISDVTRNTN